MSPERAGSRKVGPQKRQDSRWHKFVAAGAAITIGLAITFPGTALTSASAATPSLYKFASVGALTGPDALYGVSALNGEKLAISEINAAGGVNGHKFTLTAYDDQCVPTQSALVAAKIISDGSFLGVMGPVCSTSAEAALPVYARSHVEVVGDVSAPGVTAVVKKNNYKFFVRMSPQDPPQGKQMATLAIKVLGKKTVGILYSSDDYGQGVLQYAVPAVKALGGRVVASESYTPTTTKDFTPQLTKIASSGADVILLLGYYSDTGVAVGQLARAGVSPSVTVIGSDSTAQTGFVTLGGSSANGTYLIPFYWASYPSPLNVKFVKAYRQLYHVDPNGNAVCSYDSVYAYYYALKAGATPQTLAAKMRALAFPAPNGQVAFDQNGDLKGSQGVVLGVVKQQIVSETALTQKLDKAMQG